MGSSSDGRYSASPYRSALEGRETFLQALGRYRKHEVPRAYRFLPGKPALCFWI